MQMLPLIDLEEGVATMQSVWGSALVKYIPTAVLAALILPLVSKVTHVQALALAVPVTIASYAFVDRGLMHQIGNEGAVLADFVLAVLAYWWLPVWLVGVPVHLGGALTAGGAFATSEIVYHQYLLRRDVGVR